MHNPVSKKFARHPTQGHAFGVTGSAQLAAVVPIAKIKRTNAEALQQAFECDAVFDRARHYDAAH
jgi:hypothetical protein